MYGTASLALSALSHRSSDTQVDLQTTDTKKHIFAELGTVYGLFIFNYVKQFNNSILLKSQHNCNKLLL